MQRTGLVWYSLTIEGMTMAITNTQWKYTVDQRDPAKAAAQEAAAGNKTEYRQHYSGTFGTLPSEYNKDSEQADALVVQEYGISLYWLKAILSAPHHPQHTSWRARMEAAHTYLSTRTYRGHTT